MLCSPFKGSLTRDFQLQVFFTNKFPPWPLSILPGPFKIFTKIRGDIVFIASNDTIDKLFTRVQRHG